jgi:hypothetical protein
MTLCTSMSFSLQKACPYSDGRTLSSYPRANRYIIRSYAKPNQFQLTMSKKGTASVYSVNLKISPEIFVSVNSDQSEAIIAGPTPPGRK